jgi:polyribonucleotide nucleotidyltransferase
MKVRGLPLSVLAEALEHARGARNQILDAMLTVLPRPRAELSPYAPRIYTLVIDREKIGAVIGPGGKMVRKIQEDCDVNIDIEDDGTIYVTSVNAEGAERAQEMIHDLVRDVEVGETFTARVVKVTPFGAFCEIAPGKEGLIHISQLAWEHTDRTEDVVNVGDEVEVKVVEVDPMGKIRLSRKALLPRGEGRPSGDSRREPRRSGPRGDDSGGGKPYFRERRRRP